MVQILSNENEFGVIRADKHILVTTQHMLELRYNHTQLCGQIAYKTKKFFIETASLHDTALILSMKQQMDVLPFLRDHKSILKYYK